MSDEPIRTDAIPAEALGEGQTAGNYRPKSCSSASSTAGRRSYDRFQQKPSFLRRDRNDHFVPVFAIPAALQVGGGQMNGCRKMGRRKGAGNGDFWVLATAAACCPLSILGSIRD